METMRMMRKAVNTVSPRYRHKAVGINPYMENRQIVKPPWVIPAAAWQQKATSVTPLFLRYGAWQEDTAAEILSAAKAKISPLEESKRWELVKKMVNPYEMVYTHEDEHFHPSISMIKPLSRSYFKMIEMLHVLQFFENLPKQQPKIRTAHVAEGPGGFIQAVSELASRHLRILEKATAMTLKPTDQRVPGWRRAASFLHYHKEVKLHYGADGTGDVYHLANQDSFVDAVSPGVQLFTADGGFDFSVNYTIQEQRVFRLLTCSATTGLRSLAKGGCLVLKVFDMFSESTRILILLLSRCFKQWILYKPALSRPCNSERYFLGRGFLGLPTGILDALLQIQQRCEEGSFPVGFTELATPTEVTYFERHIAENTELQIVSLTRADEYVAHPEAWYTNQLPRDFETSLRWCQQFRVPPQMTKPVAITAPVRPMGGQTSSLSDRPRSS